MAAITACSTRARLLIVINPTVSIARHICTRQQRVATARRYVCQIIGTSLWPHESFWLSLTLIIASLWITCRPNVTIARTRLNMKKLIVAVAYNDKTNLMTPIETQLYYYHRCWMLLCIFVAIRFMTPSHVYLLFVGLAFHPYKLCQVPLSSHIISKRRHMSQLMNGSRHLKKRQPP